jgi:HSP20 family protein
MRERVAGRAARDGINARTAAVVDAGPTWTPISDVIECDDAIVITAELPGVRDDDVVISIEDTVLRIRGERRPDEATGEVRFYRLERSHGRFERTFALPEGIREADVSARVALGVLTITIPTGG